MADRFAVGVDDNGRTWAVLDTTSLDRQGRAWGYRIVYAGLSYEHAQALAAWMNYMGFEPPANDL